MIIGMLGAGTAAVEGASTPAACLHRTVAVAANVPHIRGWASVATMLQIAGARSYTGGGSRSRRWRPRPRPKPPTTSLEHRRKQAANFLGSLTSTTMAKREHASYWCGVSNKTAYEAASSAAGVQAIPLKAAAAADLGCR